MKNYVVFHEKNEGKCANKSRARCRSSLEEPEIEHSSSTTWQSANNNWSTIQALKGKCNSIFPEDGLLFRKKYREVGSVKYNQNLITKQLVSEELRSLHKEFGEYPEITRTKTAYREKNLFP